MRNLFFVGIGGFMGAILRYTVSGFVQNLSHRIDFPFGTLVVNVVGCFFIGALSQLVETQMVLSAEVRLLLLVGVLGAFTTYSTFSNETVSLLQDQEMLLALMNIGMHLVLGLGAVILGRFAMIAIWR